ncbi:UDP-N-acetylglucosamine 1-carboxyvinyltransferase [Rickettsiales bacterium]|nr:UDP-N-acetylglucosamine 1-carboxyvinyltransferase [Rickettsiales bacterium]MDB2550716.1 UDP-N-acetylglucosamine 1-carboxyvinyltransferase [Rickettsiales bacterium]
MKKLIIQGGAKLDGQIDIYGAKNAALPIIISSILTKEEVTFSNIPHVSDISTLISLLLDIGVKVKMITTKIDQYDGRVISFTANNVNNCVGSYKLVSKMRASILVLGPLLTRFGYAKVSLPGGCAIGARPVDLHIDALEQMGANITIEDGYVIAKGQLKGANIKFKKISVGATQNIMMAATLAEGVTIIDNAAIEPEINDLANCLVKMGAKIEGIGASKLKITGVKELSSAKYHIMPDRIEAGSYAIMAAMTNGSVRMRGVNLNIFHKELLQKLNQSGVEINEISPNIIEATRKGDKIMAIDIKTDVFPGIATDMQAQFMALMTIADKSSKITEAIFENRFMHVSELNRMGARISIDGNVATINPVLQLSGARVMATDLRASVSLVIAALIAKGETIIDRIYHLERGYERLEDKLVRCGANISHIID